MLPMGAKTMTMECGVRFLTDYLDGDHYFAVHRDGQNLDRARTQFKLVADMEKKMGQNAENRGGGSKMNVLVTGGAGYIGSHTCVELIEAGHTPIVIDNLSNSNPESLHRVAEITSKTVEFIEGDVRDEALLEKIFAEHEISCAIHFAGLKAVGESVAKPMEYYQNNLDATLTLCKVMAKHNVKRIIFSSSATVYSGDNEMPLRETSKTGNCTNPYGWTKYMGSRSCATSQKRIPNGQS